MKIYKTKKYNSYIHLDITTKKPELYATCTETQRVWCKTKKHNHT